MMAVVDYRGFRLLAESLLPIGARRVSLRRRHSARARWHADRSTCIYGSPDGGLSVRASDAAFNASMKNLAAQLNLAEHTVFTERIWSPARVARCARGALTARGAQRAGRHRRPPRPRRALLRHRSGARLPAAGAAGADSLVDVGALDVAVIGGEKVAAGRRHGRRRERERLCDDAPRRLLRADAARVCAQLDARAAMLRRRALPLRLASSADDARCSLRAGSTATASAPCTTSAWRKRRRRCTTRRFPTLRRKSARFCRVRCAFACLFCVQFDATFPALRPTDTREKTQVL